MLAVIRAQKSSISKVEECGSHEKHPRLLGRGRVKRESKDQKHTAKQIIYGRGRNHPLRTQNTSLVPDVLP